jgi:hypothetical protein
VTINASARYRMNGLPLIKGELSGLLRLPDTDIGLVARSSRC